MSRLKEGDIFFGYFFGGHSVLATPLLMLPIFVFWEMSGFQPRDYRRTFFHSSSRILFACVPLLELVGWIRGRTVQFSVDTGSLGVGGFGPPNPGVMEFDLQALISNPWVANGATSLLWYTPGTCFSLSTRKSANFKERKDQIFESDKDKDHMQSWVEGDKKIVRSTTK